MKDEIKRWEYPGRHRKRRPNRSIFSNPPKAETLAKKLLKNFQNIQVGPTSALANNWQQIAGAVCAEHSEPVRVDSAGTLYIVAENPAWATKLQWESAEILKNSKKFLEFDAIKRIQINTRK